jgi:hypothetical protein
MSSDGFARLQATLVGYSQADLCTIAEAAGYEYLRQARHGAMYPAPGTRETLRRRDPKALCVLVIQKGTELKAGAARDLRDRLELLESLKGDDDEENG